ncbi:MAG: RNA polymerase sigma factor FliA [Stenotrophobium sp.]
MNAATTIQPQTAAPEHELIVRHGELVKRIAYHMAARLPASVDVQDLIQAGAIGLLEAARHYSSDRGATFETYASIRIRGAMVDELRKGDWAPRSLHRRAREAAQAMHDIEQQTGRDARDADVAERMNVSLDEFYSITADAARCQVLSMDAQDADNEDRFQYADSADGPLQSLQHDEFQGNLAAAIASLPEREKLLLSLYYNDELNLREIGVILGVSESRVCQIHGQALLRLRARLEEWRAEAAT